MVPLPFFLETALSGPLQKIATSLSTQVLQFLGQPAFAEGNEILFGKARLQVAPACSGLRLFVGIVAIAYVYVVTVRRAWWEKAILFAALVPVAMVANAVRISAAALLSQYGLMTHRTADQFAGVVIMLPLAFFLFALVLWYLGKLIPQVEVMDMTAVVKHSRL